MYKKIYRPFIILLAFLSTACNGIESMNTQPSELEILHGMSVIDDNLLLQVRTNGCTLKEHFKLTFLDNDNKTELTVIRKKPDHCRKRTSVMEIRYSLKALNISQEKEISVKNSIQPFDGIRF